jgi:hypothetical protein
MSTLVSCGIKDKYFNSTGGTLGVPKQPTPHPTTQTQVITQPTEQNSQTQDVKESHAVDTPTSKESEESTFKWYYVVPFVGLAIIAFLVYRLKQQNLKSL